MELDEEERKGNDLGVPHSFLLLKKQQLENIMRGAEEEIWRRKQKDKAKKYGLNSSDL
jgi:hypothetical protein